MLEIVYQGDRSDPWDWDCRLLVVREDNGVKIRTHSDGHDDVMPLDEDATRRLGAFLTRMADGNYEVPNE